MIAIIHLVQILAIAKLLFYVDDGELENIGCLEMDIHFVS